MSKSFTPVIKMKTNPEATVILMKEARSLADYINLSPVAEEWTVETMPYEIRHYVTNRLRAIARARKLELQ
jgi:hypothetical protein